MKAHEFNQKYKAGTLFFCPYDSGKKVVRTIDEAKDFKGLGAYVEISLNPWFIPVSHLTAVELN